MRDANLVTPDRLSGAEQRLGAESFDHGEMSRVKARSGFIFGGAGQTDCGSALRTLICAAAAGVAAGRRSTTHHEAIGSDHGRSGTGYAFDLIDD